MDEKRINQQESLEIISEMISRTKQHLCIGSGNILLLWGYITVAVTILVWSMLLITHHPAVNWLWFLIWIIGGSIMPRMVRKERVKSGVMSYPMALSSGVWQIVGFSSLACLALCLGFLFIGGKNAWSAMLLFALLIVGFGEAAQGIIVKERSMVFGGCVGILAGIFTGCCLAADVPLYANWYMPIFIVAFVCMMIIPGHILNHKAKKEHERA